MRHHLRNRIGDPRITILMTSWQTPNTLGRKLVEKENAVRIFREEFEMRARVEVLAGFSGYADRFGLVEFVQVMEKKPQRTFIVHGEAESSANLAKTLGDELEITGIELPEAGQIFSL